MVNSIIAVFHVCHRHGDTLSAAQNSLQKNISLDATWLFQPIRSHSRKSDTYVKKWQVQPDLCCSHCQKQSRVRSHLSSDDSASVATDSDIGWITHAHALQMSSYIKAIICFFQVSCKRIECDLTSPIDLELHTLYYCQLIMLTPFFYFDNSYSWQCLQRLQRGKSINV